MTSYYDVWQQSEGGTISPVEVDVKAESPDRAIIIVAQETGIDASQLEAFEASNPGYAQV